MTVREPRRPKPHHANERREVLIAGEDVTGRLQYVTKNSRLATVVVHGRRRRIPADQLTVISTHRLPDEEQVFPCCGRAVADLLPGDRVTTDPAAVTCPGPWPRRL